MWWLALCVLHVCGSCTGVLRHAIPIHVHQRHHASVPCLWPGTHTLCMNMLSSSCPQMCLSSVGHVLACRIALELGKLGPARLYIHTRDTRVQHVLLIGPCTVLADVCSCVFVCHCARQTTNGCTQVCLNHKTSHAPE